MVFPGDFMATATVIPVVSWQAYHRWVTPRTAHKCFTARGRKSGRCHPVVRRRIDTCRARVEPPAPPTAGRAGEHSLIIVICSHIESMTWINGIAADLQFVAKANPSVGARDLVDDGVPAGKALHPLILLIIVITNKARQCSGEWRSAAP